MLDTIVYGTSVNAFTFSLVPAPLRAIIRGGLERNVGRNETVVIDGSTSYDPDDMNNNNNKSNSDLR